jgi:hypothetical protein
MLEPILSPDELWPGGIPSAIRLHPDADLSENDDLREESKGWCQFVHVCMVYYQHQHIFFMDCQKINSNTIGGVVPKTDLNEEMQQRRTLIERWASADQTFRDVNSEHVCPGRDDLKLIYHSLIMPVLLYDSPQWTTRHTFSANIPMPKSASSVWH